MIFKQAWIAAAYSVWLAGCAGGANLYAQPVAEFASAVEQTDAAVRTYATLAQRFHVDGIVATTAQSNRNVGFRAANCAPDKPASNCRLTDASSDQPWIETNATSAPPDVVMMGKMQAYAHVLVSIAGAESAADLLARQDQAAAAYAGLFKGLHAATDGDAERAKRDWKGALSSGIGSMYLANKRLALLAALVKEGDPVVAAVADTLSSVAGDRHQQFVVELRGRVGQAVDEFGVLSTAYRKNQSGLEQARYQALRREVLSRAVRETAMLQTLLKANPQTAFGEMKAAHAQLLRALTLADSDLGKAIVAIQNFSAAARKATDTINSLKGWM